MRKVITAIALLALATTQARAQLFFSEDWDDGDGSTRWSTPLTALENTTLTFDGAVDYDFDYSVLGAPSAPNSTGGSTTGVFMETNTTDAGPVDEGETVGILPLGFTLPDADFRLTADVYLFWNGGGGSTEYAIMGIHHSGSDRVPLRFPTDVNTGDGLAWKLNTDGDDVAADYLRYVNFQGAGLQTVLGTYQGIDDGSIPDVPTGDASTVGPFNQWVELSVTRTGDTVEFAMNGFVLDTIESDVTSIFSEGNLLIGQSDPFNSVNVDDSSGNSNGVVFDNIRVTSLDFVDPSIPGDFDGDGDVDGADFGVFVGEFQTGDTGGPGADAPFSQADLNESGFVDGADFGIFVDSFQNFPPAPVAVPEPISVTLLATVGVAILSVRRRRDR